MTSKRGWYVGRLHQAPLWSGLVIMYLQPNSLPITNHSECSRCLLRATSTLIIMIASHRHEAITVRTAKLLFATGVPTVLERLNEVDGYDVFEIITVENLIMLTLFSLLLSHLPPAYSLVSHMITEALFHVWSHSFVLVAVIVAVVATADLVVFPTFLPFFFFSMNIPSFMLLLASSFFFCSYLMVWDKHQGKSYTRERTAITD